MSASIPGGGFDGRVAIVTGAAGAIGAATAKRLASLGAIVVCVDRDGPGLAHIVEQMQVDGLDVLASTCDQTQPADLDRLFARVDRLPRLDICFANAGYGKCGPFLDLSLRDWQRHIDVNLTGTFRVVQDAARRMAAFGSGGSIVIAASTGAVFPPDLFSAYCVTKAALNMLVRSTAGELGLHRIRINAVMPGVIETSMTESILDSGSARAVVEAETPLGRVGSPQDIASAVAFLASDEAGFVTGTSLLIDGGQTIHGFPRWFSADARTGSSDGWVPHHERYRHGNAHA